jgi:3-phosphoshikimate 1-carboxyvinyltransferase
MEVPGDVSSAAFFVALALLLKGSELVIQKVGLNPGRVGFLEAARRMGGDLELLNRREEGGEPVGDLVVRGSSLKGIDITEKEIPGMIDELPLLALLAAHGEGETRVSGAGELRHKESDRIAVTASVINALGGLVEEEEDGFLVKGSGGIEGGRASSCGDHRIAMLLAVGGAVSRKGVTIEEEEAITVSYPRFFEDLEGLPS